MKAFTGSLDTFLNSQRGLPDSPVAFADLFDIVLSAGETIRTNSVDYPIIYGGNTYPPFAPLIQGLKYKTSVGLQVDRQQITVSAPPGLTVAGVPIMAAIANKAFDGADFTRTRVFYDKMGGTLQGGVVLFGGRISTVDSCGRTSAKITVASGLVILDYNMPRNLYSANCQHTLYDAGCGVIRASFTVTGAVGAGSTAGVINTALAAAGHAQGAIFFNTGLDAGVRATVKSVVVGTSVTLMYPLPSVPATGDSFSMSFGCDHTRGTCQGKFSNLPNFRGFPFVPSPQIAY